MLQRSVPVLLVVTLGMFAVAPFLVLNAPYESTMGLVQKIFYFHAPSGMVMFLGAFVSGIALGVAGVMLMQVGDYNNADSAFRVACDLSKAVDDVYSMLIHMNNRMAAIAALGDIETAFQKLEEINEIRNQFWDEAGIAILDANTAYLSGDVGRLEEARNWFSEQGLPQAELLDVWLFRAQNGM